MGISHHLALGKLVLSGSADQRQHDADTLRGGTGCLLCIPVQVAFLLGLRQEFTAGLLAHLQGSKQIETTIHKRPWRQGAASSKPIDDGPDTRQRSITQKLGGKIDPPY